MGEMWHSPRVEAVTPPQERPAWRGSRGSGLLIVNGTARENSPIKLAPD